MSTYALKPKFQALLRPVAASFFRAGVTANQVTVAACAVSVALGAWLALAAHHGVLFLLVPVWFVARMALNAIDGVLAREFGQASRLGAYLNELADVISDCALYVPFALLPGSDPALVMAVITFSVICEMAGALPAVVGASRRCDGPMGKSDRALAFGAVGLLVGCGIPLSEAYVWIWAALAALIVLTIFNRVRKALAELEPARRAP